MISILIIVVVFSLYSCTDKYDPKEIDTTKLLVVDALITDESEDQTIILSTTTSVTEPIWEPLSGANIIVSDKGNNAFEFVESKTQNGIYLGIIPFEYLKTGNAFQLSIIMDDGKVYESSFEELLACSEVDSVYYTVNNDFHPEGRLKSEKGVSFFLDIKADFNFSKYYRWILEETYEYHSTWPIQTYWEGEWVTLPVPHHNYFYCYNTANVNSIFTATTVNLDENLILKHPLYFVNNQTQKLYFRYSLLVKQMSISEQSYNFWEGLKKNNQNSGGIFDSQPVNVKGNVICKTDENEKVLGYFGVSSVKTKRISLTRNELHGKLIYDYNVFCEQWQLERIDFIISSPEQSWPIYIAPPPNEEESGFWYATQSCFDCRKAGGTLEVPDFWKNN